MASQLLPYQPLCTDPAGILGSFWSCRPLDMTLSGLLWSLWSCRPPCIDPAIFLWSFQSCVAPCMDAVGLPWLIWSCMDPGVFPRLPPCPDCHACTPPISCGFSGPADHRAWTPVLSSVSYRPLCMDPAALLWSPQSHNPTHMNPLSPRGSASPQGPSSCM